jgi:hypothetical protein
MPVAENPRSLGHFERIRAHASNQTHRRNINRSVPRRCRNRGCLGRTVRRAYLFRGMFDLIHWGMDQLAERINRTGVAANIGSQLMWRSVADQAISDYRRDPKPEIPTDFYQWDHIHLNAAAHPKIAAELADESLQSPWRIQQRRLYAVIAAVASRLVQKSNGMAPGIGATALISSATDARWARLRPCHSLEGILESRSLLQQRQELVID